MEQHEWMVLEVATPQGTAKLSELEGEGWEIVSVSAIMYRDLRIVCKRPKTEADEEAAEIVGYFWFSGRRFTVKAGQRIPEGVKISQDPNGPNQEVDVSH